VPSSPPGFPHRPITQVRSDMDHLIHAFKFGATAPRLITIDVPPSPGAALAGTLEAPHAEPPAPAPAPEEKATFVVGTGVRRLTMASPSTEDGAGSYTRLDPSVALAVGRRDQIAASHARPGKRASSKRSKLARLLHRNAVPASFARC
jgi:hypothetical protein